MKNHRRIVVEEAFCTPAIYAEWQKLLRTGNVEPGFKKMGQTVFGETPAAHKLLERLNDVGAGRIAHMDATGIDVQVISIASPGVQVFTPEMGAALAREANDVVHAATSRNPKRLFGLTTVAPQAVRESVAEIERGANKLGMRGLLINSHTGGLYLDDPRFFPILEAAEALGQPIYLHPREPSPGMVTPYLDYGLYFAGWGFAAETGLHAMRLIMSGVFARFPNLMIILGHMGEGIPFWLQRIDNRYEMQARIGGVERLKRLPSEYFLDNFVITTSGVTQAASLKLCVEVLGADRIMFAADYPYESVEEGVAFIDGVDISEGDRTKILSENAARVFRIP